MRYRPRRDHRSSLLLVITTLVITPGVGCGQSSADQDAAGDPDPELARRVEQLLPRVEEVSGLTARQVPPVRRASRSSLEAYLLERLDAEFPGDTVRNIERAYRAFGLLPDTVDLRELLVDLLLEQTIGYYDPGRDRLFVREEVPAGGIDVVLVHELVHALQDQHTDLDSLLRSRPENDARAAVQAAVEGHATVAMLLYMMSEALGTSVTVEQLPDLGGDMGGLVADPAAMPQLARAPAIVRETLIFSYLGGARFVRGLWLSVEERRPPLREWLPESTEQLLHLERILERRDSPTRMELFGFPGGWEVPYSSDLGELETRIYFEEHLSDPERARRAAAGWDGDAFALLSQENRVVLVWYTAWDSEADAEEFEAAYRDAFTNRHGSSADGPGLVAPNRRADVERLKLEGMSVVRVVEGPRDVTLEPVPRARIR